MIVMAQEQATAIGNMHRKFGEVQTSGFRDMLADRKKPTHTDTLITILHALTGGRVNTNTQTQGGCRNERYCSRSPD